MTIAVTAPLRVALGICILLASSDVVHAETAPGLPGPETLAAALAGQGDAEIVVWRQAHPGVRPRLVAATSVAVPAARLRALIAAPETYRRALPSIRRVEVVSERPASGGPGVRPVDRLLAWEVEVPLWNLRGRLWLRPRPDGADIELAQGDFAPGLIRIRAGPGPAGTLLFIDVEAKVRDAHFVARRLAARSPLAEPAMLAVAAECLLRGLALEARRSPEGRADPRRQPRSAMTPPAWGALDGGQVTRLWPGGIAEPLVVGIVHSRADGRLHHVEVAVGLGPHAASAAGAVAHPQTWRALPGWRRVEALGGTSPTRWRIDSRFPFVDFDAVWELARATVPLRAVVVEGDTRGAVLGCDVDSTGDGVASLVLSMHPRVEKTGMLPRKLIEAEPLLEHALSLGLGYAYAVSLGRAARAHSSQ